MVLLTAIDQVVKLWAINNLKPVGVIPVIDGVFSFIYVENRGAAFGIMQNMQLPLGIFSLICVIIGFVIIYANKVTDKWQVLAISLIISGGLGNFIDRIFRQFVVDMFATTFIDFPVFNFADCCVVVGSLLLVLLILLEDLNKAKKSR